MIKAWLESYAPKNEDEATQALREIMQEVALAGLYRSGFFEKVAFYGGTALRVFYGLNRYSEDLDFSLLTINPSFNLEHYLKPLQEEFSSLGLQVSVRNKEKSFESAIESAFLKPDTNWKELILEGSEIPEWRAKQLNLKIKLEVDTNPPPGFETEDKLLLRPFSCYIKCFSAPDLFAGKAHALLFRKWKTRVKGRDWFDFEWYIRQGIPLHLSHLSARAVQSNDWINTSAMTKNDLLKLLSEKIQNVSWEHIKNDASRFIPDQKVLRIWSSQYFLDLIQHLKVV